MRIGGAYRLAEDEYLGAFVRGGTRSRGLQSRPLHDIRSGVKKAHYPSSVACMGGSEQHDPALRLYRRRYKPGVTDRRF